MKSRAYEDRDLAQVPHIKANLKMIRAKVWKLRKALASAEREVERNATHGFSDEGEYEMMNLWDKAYCLPKEYFENENAPYRVYRVDNDEEVI